MKKEKKNIRFKCRVCENTIEAAETSGDQPECCNKPMEKMEELPPCSLSATAEHARPEDSIEPCDDGRAGKI